MAGIDATTHGKIRELAPRACQLRQGQQRFVSSMSNHSFRPLRWCGLRLSACDQCGEERVDKANPRSFGIVNLPLVETLLVETNTDAEYWHEGASPMAKDAAE